MSELESVVMIMTEYCSADLCKMSLQEVADLLLDKLSESGKEQSSCLVHGCCDGRMFELKLEMRCIE